MVAFKLSGRLDNRSSSNPTYQSVHPIWKTAVGTELCARHKVFVNIASSMSEVHPFLRNLSQKEKHDDVKFAY